MTNPLARMENQKLSVVVPVFNEAPQIAQNLGLLLAEIEPYFKDFEVIVVSDGSTDETNLRLGSFQHKGVRPLILNKNEGKGHAVRTGFAQASGDYVLFIDGGMEIHPKEIRIFVGLMLIYEADIVLGSKRHPQSKVDYPYHRRILSWGFQQLVRILFDVDVTDTQVGIKLLRRPVVSAILPHLEINRYGFDLEILTLARLKGFGKFLEAPIRMDYFSKNRRALPVELLHILSVSASLISDTFKLHRRLRQIRKEQK